MFEHLPACIGTREMLLPMETRRRDWTPLELQLQVAVNYMVDARD